MKSQQNLVNSLYNEPNLFKDEKTGDLVQDLAIEQLSGGGHGVLNLLEIDPNTVLSTLGKLPSKLEADIRRPINLTPDVYRDLARAYYERFSGEYIKGSEE